MNKNNYFLVFASVPFLFFVLSSAIINIFFPDLGNMGQVTGLKFAKYFLSLYVLFATVFIGLQLQFLGKSKISLVVVLVMLCVYLLIPLKFLLTLLLFVIVIFFAVVGSMTKEKTPQETVTSKKDFSTWRIVIFSIAILYTSFGILFLSTPYSRSNYNNGFELSACENVKYVNLFLFKVKEAIHCWPGI